MLLDYFLDSSHGDFSVTILPQFFFQLLIEISSAKIGQQSWKKALSKVVMLRGHPTRI